MARSQVFSKLWWLYSLLIVVLVVIGDQLLKKWIVANVPLNTAKPVIPGVFSLAHVRNDGAAWSILSGRQPFLIGITVIALVVLGYLLFHYRYSTFLTIGISLMIAGAVGNFIDRLRQGYVVDMFQLDFINFPVANVADIAMTVGVALLFIYLLFLDKGRNS
ncbi:signal peptidase II [Schleiferilactobacillus harbinensis]|uniref:signal peptidase II n=1 Tax=Schleiferilactobacillus harbinensis TaxID=304207 RepID=UPI0021A893B5|nr:signal peptidase II [Schleiferilactobacillus harbinensis]MCT2907422.1 signal peptidase II [Schleiferilactobacillus harbinensis]